jgi:hypothetical protein
MSLTSLSKVKESMSLDQAPFARAVRSSSSNTTVLIVPLCKAINFQRPLACTRIFESLKSVIEGSNNVVSKLLRKFLELLQLKSAR